MKTIIYLIRHGEVDFPLNEKGERMVYGSGASLSKKGEQQIRNLCQKIKKQGGIEAVYSSPYPRTFSSAEVIAKQFGNLAISKEDDLQDLKGSPQWTKLTMEQLAQIKGDVYQEGVEQETKEELASRMITVIEKIVGENPGKTIAVITHGDPIRWLIQLSEHPGEKLPSMDILSQSDYLDNAQAWKLTFDDSFKLKEREFVPRGDENFPEGKPPKLERK